MDKERLNSIIRTTLTFVGALLTGNTLHYFFGHIIDTAYWQEITGIVLGCVSAYWSIQSKTLDIEKLQGGIRHVITFIGGILVAKGLLTNETIIAIGAFVTALLPLWQAHAARQKSQQLDQGKITIQDLKK